MTKIQSANPSEVGDVDLMFPGDRFPVTAGPDLRITGWRGGLFVKYVAGNSDFIVEASDGNSTAGFLLFQSEYYSKLQPGSFGSNGDPLVGSPENWISHQFKPRGGNNTITLINGGTRAYFKAFETIALNGAGARAGGDITYQLNESLKVSERGYLCNDSNANLNAAGVVTPIVVGIVSAVPSELNGYRLCVDLKY